MNVQRWVVASVVVTVVVAILEMIIHGFILQAHYQATAAVWRPQAEAQALMPLMWLGYAVFAPFFVWIYAQGIDPKEDAIGQGVRFGLMLGIGLKAVAGRLTGKRWVSAGAALQGLPRWRRPRSMSRWDAASAFLRSERA